MLGGIAVVNGEPQFTFMQTDKQFVFQKVDLVYRVLHLVLRRPNSAHSSSTHQCWVVLKPDVKLDTHDCSNDNHRAAATKTLPFSLRQR